MIEYAVSGSRKYWKWLGALSAVFVIGFLAYLRQLDIGLGVTGMTRDVTWGFYIAQFTFMVGVAASAVMVVLPYYLHNYKQFGRITILGEFLAIGSVVVCLTFVIVDLGQPMRVLNVWLFAAPNSVMFYDTIVLFGYLVLNAVIGWVVLSAQYAGEKPPGWIKPVIYLSIPWAVSIHTVTAFLYSGLASKHHWATAITAPRFLASAFASGPALLIILCLVVRKISKFDPGKEAIQKLAQIVAYAMIVNVFFVLLEIFTVFYGNVPGHMSSFIYQFAGHGEANALVGWMWLATFMAVGGIIILLFPQLRKNESLLALAAVLVFAAAWIDKGMGFIVSGFVPNSFHQYNEYAPTFNELVITLGVYALGILIISVLYKMALTVKEKME